MFFKAPHLPSGTTLPHLGSFRKQVLQRAEPQGGSGLDSCSPLGRELAWQLADLDLDKQELILNY